MVQYWLSLFTPETWGATEKNGFKVTGFRKSREKISKKIKPGDLFICYITKISRFSGILEATSSGYINEEKSKEIWGTEDFSCIVDVKPKITFDITHSIPKEEVFKKLQ
ncbi:MAG: EVE domain-containing protein, partial [Candidatus Micrarchaeia archaeon]